MNAADGGAGVLISRGGHGAGVENNKSGFRGLFGALQTAFPQLAFDGRTVRLGSPAAEIYNMISRHRIMLAQSVGICAHTSVANWRWFGQPSSGGKQTVRRWQHFSSA